MIKKQTNKNDAGTHHKQERRQLSKLVPCGNLTNRYAPESQPIDCGVGTPSSWSERKLQKLLAQKRDFDLRIFGKSFLSGPSGWSASLTIAA